MCELLLLVSHVGEDVVHDRSLQPPSLIHGVGVVYEGAELLALLDKFT